jgi:segregation and condensation protein A
MLEISVDSFEGPLDLLLRLIEQEQLDITDVSLAKVTDQYLQKLSELSLERHVDELADFLVIAAKLLLIKSRLLLPHITQEEEEEIDDLQQRLKIYQEYLQAAKQLEKLYNAKTVSFPRSVPQVPQTVQFAPPNHCTSALLGEVFRSLIATLEIPVRIPKKIVFDSRVSIQEKMSHIRALISQCGTMRFHQALTLGSVSDIVVSFMALLELIKQRAVLVEQEELFSDIHILTHASQ